MTLSRQNGPSLFSCTLQPRDSAQKGILAALSGDGGEQRAAGSGRVPTMGVLLASVLVALAVTAYLVWPRGVVEAPVVSVPPGPVSAPTPPEPIVDLPPNSGPAARIVVVEAEDPPSPPPAVAVASWPPTSPEPAASVQAGGTGEASAPVKIVKAPRPEIRASASPPAELGIDREDSDVRLLAALMVHAGPTPAPDDVAFRALRECGVFAPPDREVCVARLCALGRAPAAICGANAEAR